jgi:hypothetical protein
MPLMVGVVWRSVSKSYTSTVYVYQNNTPWRGGATLNPWDPYGGEGSGGESPIGSPYYRYSRYNHAHSVPFTPYRGTKRPRLGRKPLQCVWIALQCVS